MYRFGIFPAGDRLQSTGSRSAPCGRDHQNAFFSPKGIDQWIVGVNVIFGIDGTLSGYNCQQRSSYTGLRSATLCFAIQPLRGKDNVAGRI